MGGLSSAEPAEQAEDPVHAEEGQGDDEEPGNRSAAHRDLNGLNEASPGGCGGSYVGLDADVHADDPGGHRAGGPDEEGQPGPPAEIETEHAGIGNILRLEQGDDAADNERADEGQQPDRRVLAADERHRTFEDHPGDVLHFLRPGVTGEDVTGEVNGEQDGDQPGGQDDQLKLTGVHRGARFLQVVDMGAGRRRARDARVGACLGRQPWPRSARGNSRAHDGQAVRG